MVDAAFPAMYEAWMGSRSADHALMVRRGQTRGSSWRTWLEEGPAVQYGDEGPAEVGGADDQSRERNDNMTMGAVKIVSKI